LLSEPLIVALTHWLENQSKQSTRRNSPWGTLPHTMSTLLKIVFLALGLLLAITSIADALPYTQPFTPRPPTVEQIIVKQAIVYATPAEPLLRVAMCESTMNPKALNPKDVDGLPAYGLFQFKKTTFIGYAQKAGLENPDIWNVEHQAQVAAYMFAHGEKRQWGCR